MNKYKIKIHSKRHSQLVQERLFEIGVEWFTNGKQLVMYKPMDFIYINNNIIYSDEGDGINKTITLDDLYAKGEELFQPSYQEVKLNDDYTAKVYKDKVVVGCQEFDVDVIYELIKAHQISKQL